MTKWTASVWRTSRRICRPASTRWPEPPPPAPGTTSSLGRHRGDRPGEEAEQQILQPTKRNIEPARQKKVAAEELLSRAPQVFRDRSHRAKPATECLAEQERHGQKRDQQKHARRMQRRHMVGKNEVAQVHQTGDRQPALTAP